LRESPSSQEKSEDKKQNAERKRKEDFFFPFISFSFFLFYGIFDFFGGVSGLDTGITRIVSPSSRERSEDKKQTVEMKRKRRAKKAFFFV
jgi:hypothetical protein